MPDTVTIDAPLSADAAKVYKGVKADPYVNARTTPAGAADASPSISNAKVSVTLNRGEEAWVVFTASGAFVAARKVKAGFPWLALDSISPSSVTRNTGTQNLTLTGGPFLPTGSVEVYIDGVRIPLVSVTNAQIVAAYNTQGQSAGTKVVKVRRAGVDSGTLNLTVA